MRLDEVLRDLDFLDVRGELRGEAEIRGIRFDSRRVQPGDLFFAVPGFVEDGAKYSSDAQQRGAVAIVTKTLNSDVTIPQIVVEDVRTAMAVASRNFFGDPARDLSVIGITGTNGKTTTAYLIRHILNSVGHPCGMLGTVENDLCAGEVQDATRTTPESAEIFAYLARMRDNGAKAAVLEVSSHALELHRVDGLNFSAAVFTNLTQDHLDFHNTMANYARAKGRLFDMLSCDATAILNAGQQVSREYAERTPARVLPYLVGNAAENRNAEDPADGLRAENIRTGIRETAFTLKYREQTVSVHWPVPGLHNIENALGAVGAALSIGIDFVDIAEALHGFPGVPGRLESVAPASCPFAVYVDYAHTDDALSRVLSAIRRLNPNRILTVFGCGGDRDTTKRPKMARAAEAASDLVVITSDNPRSEDPDAIIRDVLQGIEEPFAAVVEPDRSEAIRIAVELAGPGDVVLIAGKGHETYQIFADRTEHFDDREEARRAISERFGTPAANATEAA